MKDKDLLTTTASAFSDVNIRLLVIMFILFLLVNTEAFDKCVLSRFSGTLDIDRPTTWGYIIKAMMFVVLYIIFDLLIQNDVL